MREGGGSDRPRRADRAAIVNRRGFLRFLGIGVAAAPFVKFAVDAPTATPPTVTYNDVAQSAYWVYGDRKLRDGAGGTVGAVLWPVYIDPNVAPQGADARIIAYGDMSDYYRRQFRGKWRWDGPDGLVPA